MVDGCSFSKTICSICYEDLKPVVEDLQAISICGHVFHELCLQQWFEYCSSSSKKKNSCPVCKQTCIESSVRRLYFQSVGGPNDTVLSQKPAGQEEDPEALRREVKILEVKVSGLNSALEHHQKNLKDVNDELCICKEHAKKEMVLKNEALSQKSLMQQLLYSKSEELEKSTLERLRLQERSMALAKELAALKLVSDLNLEEDEVLKLASLGNQANSKDTVDILKKSLVIRNKSYKELMEKCNLLGRGETRSLRKLEKAKERMNKLKARVQELETAIEVKDNEILRALKASKKSKHKGDTLNGARYNSTVPSHNNKLSEDCIDQFGVSMSNLDRRGGLTNEPFHVEKKDTHKDVCVNDINKDTRSLDPETVSYVLIDDDDSEIRKTVHPDLKSQTCKDAHQSNQIRLEVASDSREDPVHWSNIHATVFNEDGRLPLDDVSQVQPLLQIRKENSSSAPLAQPADRCFSGGLLGPDGTNRYLGKWCKRNQGKGSLASSIAMKEGSSTIANELLAVGADGRGGRIKVLRSLNQSLDVKESPVLAKRCKYGAKTSSQGCLQIEHFFGKAGH